MDKTDLLVGVVIGIAVIGVCWGSYSYIEYRNDHPCIASHQETQYEAPPSIVVGGSKYGGGVAIPIGNLRPVQVTVCDQYK